MSSKTQKILDAILQGVKADPPSDKMLRGIYWEIVPQYKITTLEWRELMDKYVRNPRFSGGKAKKSSYRDRAQRLTTTLTGGSDPSKQPEFTWRRFNEGLAAMDLDTLTVAVTATRGKFNTKKTVRAITSPKDEMVKYINDKADIVEDKAISQLFAQYLSDTKKASREMEHILSKLLWSLFDEYGINKTMWETQIQRYLNNKDNCAQLQHNRNDKKNNLLRAIVKRKRLTWDRFLEALKVIEVKEIEIAFLTKRQGFPPVEASCTIDLTALSFKSGGNKDEAADEDDDVHAK